MTIKNLKYDDYCDKCTQSILCTPITLNGIEIDMVGSIVNHQQFVKRGDFIFHQGDKFRSIIAITQGAVKLSVKSNQTQEQVLGFRLIGEIVGLNGIHTGNYLTDAQAIENSFLCEIPYEMLDRFAYLMPKIQHELRRLLSHELIFHQYQSISLGKKTAEKRLASFLLNISHRYSQRGFFSADHYILPMPRHDIANFLGLTKETVSRTFHQFREKGVLLTQKKHVHITNFKLLKTIAGEED